VSLHGRAARPSDGNFIMRTSRWVLVTYAAIILFGMMAALPNLLTESQRASLPSFLPNQAVTLGLDLKGGSHLVLEVDEAGLAETRLQSLLEEVRAIAGPSSGARIDGDRIVVDLRGAGEREQITDELNALATPIGGLGFGANARDLAIETEGNRVVITQTEDGVRDRMNAAVEQSVEIIRSRVDQVGVAEPVIQRVGANRILVQLPGLQDPTRLRQLLGSTAQMSFHMLDDRGLVDGRARPGATAMADSEGARYAVEDRVAISGDRLADARAGFDQRTNEPIVSFSFDSRGAQQFAEITRNNVGRPFAIVLDGTVLTAPVIREPILGGQGQISGNFSPEETTVLSALLRSGSLPAPLTIIEERTVGPNLGGDSIEMGIYTGVAGFALVVGLMLLLYGGWGMIANLALGLNVMLTLGALSLLGATLTLPGIAGIILGIGLAVDANILINSRIREETEAGASAMKALDIGFKRAYSTIVDANVTTLFATTLLFMFGTGPVRGFAITMMLGVAISMFTAVTVVRVLMTEIVARRKIRRLEMKPLFGLIGGTPAFRFMRGRFVAIGLSAMISIASITLFINPGLNYGIDFTGGIQVEASTDTPIDLAALRGGLAALDLGDVALQTAGSDRSVLVRVQRQEGGEAAQTAALAKVRSTLEQVAGEVSIERAEVVGPTVSGELARSGFLAVGLAMLAMLAYIWWRFEWHFAVGAIAVLILDVTKTVGFFTLSGLDFNLTAVAALLTMIGYSVNDKVVVYDRMRENLRRYKVMPFSDLIDLSINQVLARCIFTSMTTALALLPMALYGGAPVASFAWPLLFGVVIATTSSLFIAGPILLFLSSWWHRRRAARQSADEEPVLATGLKEQ
jgi:SecD/SecF fusion protein